jgi:hypothetical protein
MEDPIKFLIAQNRAKEEIKKIILAGESSLGLFSVCREMGDMSSWNKTIQNLKKNFGDTEKTLFQWIDLYKWQKDGKQVDQVIEQIIQEGRIPLWQIVWQRLKDKLTIKEGHQRIKK